MDDPSDVDVLSSEAFIQGICSQHAEGFGFIPLLGAGISVPSGILSSPDLKHYLLHCIVSALNDSNIWIPRYDPWPSTPDTLQKSPDPETVVRSFSSNKPPHFLEAMSSISDWRAALQFLSRIDRDDHNQLQLAAIEDVVTDSFFLHICANATPNVAHRMMVNLVDPLRVPTILTTNFDELLEAAFEEANLPLVSFPVPHNSDLPPARNVVSQLSLVKLHGGRHGLRADYSLDRPATKEEQATFLDYLTRTARRSPAVRNTFHILVAGYAGADARTRSFLTAALEAFTDFHLYWVCYMPEEPGRVRRSFARFRKRVHVTQAGDVGVLLLQLYQHLLGCIPPGGIAWPAMWQLPMPTGARTPRQKEAGAAQYQAKKSALLGLLAPPEGDPSGRLVLFLSRADVRGVSTIASDAFNSLEPYHPAIWLDLDDFLSFGEFIGALADAIARKTGQIHYVSSYDSIDSFQVESICDEVEEMLATHGRRWLIMLNARDKLGANAEGEWSEPDKQGLSEVLQCLSARAKSNTTIVVLGYHNDLPSLERATSVVSLDATCIGFDPQQALDELVSFLRRAGQKGRSPVRFIYALTLFKHLRYPASLWTWMVQVDDEILGDRDVARMSFARKWIKLLIDRGVVQRKQGGFIGIHGVLKTQLREKLLSSFAYLREHEVEIHQCIADWYHKLFMSSTDPRTVYESVHHRIEAARAAMRNRPEESKHGDTVVGSAMQEAINTLTLARRVVLTRGDMSMTNRCLDRLRDLVSVIRHPLANDYLQRLDVLRIDAALEWAAFERVHEVIQDKKQLLTKGVEPHEVAYDELRLALALRSYSTVEQRGAEIDRALACPGQWIDEGEIAAVRRAAAEWAESATSKIRLDCAKALRHRMHTNIVKAQAQYLSEPSRYACNEPRFQSLERANRCYHCATEILRFVEERRDGFLQVEGAYLRTLEGLLLGNLGRFHEAQRRLLEAESYLASRHGETERSAMAVVLLRRAEVFLLQCNAEFTPDESWDEYYWRKVANRERTDEMRIDTRGPNAKVRVLVAKLSDAAKCLTKASSSMRGRRRSAWWWSVYYVLEMKLLELTRAVRMTNGTDVLERYDGMFQTGGRRPALQRVVQEIERFTKVDTFFIARIAEGCGRLLRMEKKSDDGLVTSTGDVLKLLDNVRARRDRWAEYPLDEAVRKYVDDVEKEAKLAHQASLGGDL